MKGTNEKDTPAKRVASVRARTTLNQRDFAVSLGISPRAYQNYERGEREITADLIRALYTRYQVDPIWLLTGEAAEGKGPRPATGGNDTAQIDVRVFREIFAEFAATAWAWWTISLSKTFATIGTDLGKLWQLAHNAKEEQVGNDVTLFQRPEWKAAFGAVVEQLHERWATRELLIAMFACEVYNRVIQIEDLTSRRTQIKREVGEILRLEDLLASEKAIRSEPSGTVSAPGRQPTG